MGGVVKSVGKALGIVKKPKAPPPQSQTPAYQQKVIEPPDPVIMPKEVVYAEDDADPDRQRRRKRRRARTMVTGGQGLSGEAATEKKTLLGG
tara:strand:- start:710 stop:985 length:276 start_codon:yes stop_codon:yes gene_type:complete